MVGPDELTRTIQNRKSGQTVIYGSDNHGGYWITVTGACINNLPYRSDYPWKRDLKDLIAMSAKFRETFKTAFRGGWIPHKGYGGPSVAPDPPETTTTPAPLDLRRAIRVITTPRQCLVP